MQKMELVSFTEPQLKLKRGSNLFSLYIYVKGLSEADTQFDSTVSAWC